MKKSLWIVLILFLWSSPLMAQSEGSQKEGSHSDAPSMEEMMAAYMKFAEPGEHHAMLKPMAGEWVADGKFRMGPEGDWMTSKSDASFDWILGGRFLKQEIASPANEFMPEFHGLGYLGYDNFKKKYISIWMDSMGTMFLTNEGGGGSNKIALEGEYADPLSGDQKAYRWVYEIHDDDHFTMMMFEAGPDGSEYLHGEVHYSRKKD